MLGVQAVVDDPTQLVRIRERRRSPMLLTAEEQQIWIPGGLECRDYTGVEMWTSSGLRTVTRRAMRVRRTSLSYGAPEINRCLASSPCP